ncbi:testis-specific serine/threonine-protein kinase 3-like isoform X2 [Apis laboriosa]|uniref:testis-specific serine/threonine-protein kinase 3-like isoform X2 n=1 Tax=Apis dorsata TaxID=7462 RepID=UPI0012934F2C|nr:testis-specific serine/threonine-protein kinase 3-like isoform X2 [Apis dorsata]XP_043793675.1 testis-specific serine/threonine-protein kinase 3-like isoform X2 [Apis laboriosa]
MATAPITDNSPKSLLKLVEDKNDKSEKKLTILESHGYTLGKTIGAGSYATVKIAKSDRHDCQVAVKIVSKFQAPGDYLKKFLPREIEVVKGLKHPNLIRFLQAIETTHRVYIIMEYAQCGSLLDIIRRDTFIDEFRSRRWFRQLLEAIDYCHGRGVVHSYAYASPEILKGVPYLPQLSDVWSMGVVLYAMVYGRLPFDDTNYSQLLKQVQNKVVFPKEPNVSQACRSLISRILVPQRIRMNIDNIRNDTWLAESLVTVETSTTDIPMDTSTIRNVKKITNERNKETKNNTTDIGAQIIDKRLT